MKPLRVLHVITGLGAGGAETALYRLASRGSDIEHEIVSMTARDWYSSPLEELGVRVHHLDITSTASAIRSVLRLYCIMRRSGADVVQCWMYRSNVLAGVLGRLLGMPVLWNIRCSSPELLGLTSRLWARAAGALARFVPAVVVNCSARSAETHAKLGYAAANVEIIPNGYDAEDLFPDDAVRRATREGLNVGKETFLLGSITRWDVYKDIPVLLRALRMVHDGGVRLKCLLVGHLLDLRNEQLVHAIEEAGCGDIIIPLGRRDVRDLARAMDLHILASRSEGFPNVVAETMLSGTPNAVSNVGDAALITGETGWIVPPREPERLAEAIKEAYREWQERPRQWANRRAAARQRILDNFTLARMVESYETMWRTVARQRSR